MTDDEQVLVFFAKFFLGLLSMVIVSMFGGLVLSLLWGWFFVPLGLPQIGIGLALGISLTLSYLTHQFDWKKRASWLLENFRLWCL